MASISSLLCSKDTIYFRITTEKKSVCPENKGGWDASPLTNPLEKMLFYDVPH